MRREARFECPADMTDAQVPKALLGHPARCTRRVDSPETSTEPLRSYLDSSGCARRSSSAGRLNGSLRCSGSGGRAVRESQVPQHGAGGAETIRGRRPAYQAAPDKIAGLGAQVENDLWLCPHDGPAEGGGEFGRPRGAMPGWWRRRWSSPRPPRQRHAMSPLHGRTTPCASLERCLLAAPVEGRPASLRGHKQRWETPARRRDRSGCSRPKHRPALAPAAIPRSRGSRRSGRRAEASNAPVARTGGLHRTTRRPRSRSPADACCLRADQQSGARGHQRGHQQGKRGQVHHSPSGLFLSGILSTSGAM